MQLNAINCYDCKLPVRIVQLLKNAKSKLLEIKTKVLSFEKMSLND